MSLPPFLSLAHILIDETNCINWMLENGVLDRVTRCPVCDGDVRLSEKLYHCRSRNCRKKVSVLAGSFFAGSRLKCNEILLFGYYWLGGCSHSQLSKFTGFGRATVTEYMQHFRQLISESLEPEDTLIGGDDITVEVDESKFGKRKANRGHHVEGVWVIGGVERTEARRIFVEVVSDRSAATLLEVIGRHVRPGSIVNTDLWRGYSGLSEALDVQHRTVNHSLHFVSPEGVHTNTIEGTWNGIKFIVPARNRTISGMSEYLPEVIWRRKNNEDLFGGLVHAFRITLYE
jgi:transposase-like protein